MSPTPTPDQVEDVLAPGAQELGLDLEAVQVAAAGRRRVLRVLVDKDGGVTLDDLAEATRALSAALDADEVMGESAYTLEVSSPGVDRPLTLPRHWRRNVSRLVQAALADGSMLTGRVLRNDDRVVILDVDGTERAVAYADLANARVQVELNRKEA